MRDTCVFDGLARPRARDALGMRHSHVGHSVRKKSGGEKLDGVRRRLLDGGCVVHVNVRSEGKDEHGMRGLVDDNRKGEGHVNAFSKLENRVGERRHVILF